MPGPTTSLATDAPFSVGKHDRHVVSAKLLVGCDHGHVLDTCLSHQQTIEWVPVMKRRLTSFRSMIAISKTVVADTATYLVGLPIACRLRSPSLELSDNHPRRTCVCRATTASTFLTGLHRCSQGIEYLLRRQVEILGHLDPTLPGTR